MIIELFNSSGKVIRRFYTNAKSPKNAAKKYAKQYDMTAYIIIHDYDSDYRYDFATSDTPKKLWRKV